MNFSTIDWHIDQKMGHLVLNRPPANKMDRIFFNELRLLTSYIIPESSVSGIIIYGKGRHFSSGADLDDLLDYIYQNRDNGYSDFFEHNLESFSFFRTLKIPVIAAIRGVCIGSGFELALSCHYRICAEGALLGLPETSFGLIPGCGGIHNLTEITGRSKAMELILTGRNLDTEEAKKLGVIDKVVEKNKLIQEAVNTVQKLILR